MQRQPSSGACRFARPGDRDMDAQGYLKLAEDCLAQAAVAPDPERRLHWLAMAEKWLKLAHQVQIWNEPDEGSTGEKG
jgi:hypothetical protein